MVVGNGFLAKAFKSYLNNDDVIIFASGVSKSTETLFVEFQRELDLLRNFYDTPKKFIYFSTVSTIDGSEKSDYINHKMNVESIIANKFTNYLIFRLPIVVGNDANNVTFFNSIKRNIIEGNELEIYNVGRYLIDIEDLSKFLPIFIDDQNEKNKIINVCFDNFNDVSYIIEKMEFYLNKSVKKTYKLYKKNHQIESKYFISKSGLDQEGYTDNLIKKYLVSPEH